MKILTAIGILFACGILLSCNMEDKVANAEGKGKSATEAVPEFNPAEIETAIVIHGGAGSMQRGKMSEEKEEAYMSALDSALLIGEAAIEKGNYALDVVEEVIIFLENHPLFNSGKGAVLTSKGEAELDASLMDGKTLNAGAVTGVKTIKNPILAARLVMDSSSHVMLAGEGAEAFAKDEGLEMVTNDYFITDRRRKSFENSDKHGTVGCVVLDKDGNLAAGTSTGGISQKMWGRIGDSPIIGAGTYADNTTCAVSCTGQGEFFIRKSVAHSIHAKMKYAAFSLQKAAQDVLQEVEDLGGTGGLIAVDRQGNIAMPFNTSGMFRAYKNKEGRGIRIFKE